MDIGQPDLSIEGFEELQGPQDPVTCQDEPEIVNIGQPEQSCEGVEELQNLQDPSTCQAEPEIVDIGQPDQSCEGVEELQELQDPSTCQDEPEIMDIGQPDQSCEGFEELQDPSTCQDEPEIMGIGQPDQSCEGVEELQDPVTCQDEPEIVDISQPAQSSEGVEELQDPVTCQDKPEIVDISQPAQSSEGVEELQEPQDPSTCQEKPFVKKCQPLKKSSIRLLWEVRVPQSLVGRFIGQKGRHINFLKKKSGAKIDIITPASSKEFKIILVAGTEEQMSTAAAMITEWFKKCELDLPSFTPRPRLPRTQIQDPSTSQDQPETVDKFVWEARVPKRLVGSIIGPRGCNLKSLMKKSGAKIDIITPASSEEFEIISVDGKEEQIGTAAAMIIEWFKTSDVDLPPYTPRRE
ncbi:A-kinase anchor protein 1, mitochondrial-like [Astyanax mexicanus]|uniref:A-kinase anchor protein 1, mitochondrial-like n=1 Tax=Astyanax mexicanus TaxID=7994 RepID=UPI0020CB036C|nr:A-kinase anchor protein 1, mitochondrial-like [Astyanax mexicanus]